MMACKPIAPDGTMPSSLVCTKWDNEPHKRNHVPPSRTMAHRHAFLRLACGPFPRAFVLHDRNLCHELSVILFLDWIPKIRLFIDAKGLWKLFTSLKIFDEFGDCQWIWRLFKSVETFYEVLHCWRVSRFFTSLKIFQECGDFSRGLKFFTRFKIFKECEDYLWVFRLSTRCEIFHAVEDCLEVWTFLEYGRWGRTMLKTPFSRKLLFRWRIVRMEEDGKVHIWSPLRLTENEEASRVFGTDGAGEDQSVRYGGCVGGWSRQEIGCILELRTDGDANEKTATGSGRTDGPLDRVSLVRSYGNNHITFGAGIGLQAPAMLPLRGCTTNSLRVNAHP